MSIIVTPMHETKNSVERHYIRISNDRGDTIDLGAGDKLGTHKLALALITHAKSLTIIEVWDPAPHP